MAKTQFLAVTGFYFLSVAFVWIFHADSAEAKWIRVRGSSVLSTGLKTSMKYAVRHYSSYSSADIARCANLAQRETGYVCDTDSPIANMPDFNILEIENQIEAAKKRLNFAAGNVDQYSKASVNNYNALVSTYNRLIAEHGKLVEEHNAALERDCVSYANFCKPYDCEKKQSWTSYRQSDGSCFCSNGKIWNSSSHCDSPKQTTAVSESNSSQANGASKTAGNEKSSAGVFLTWIVIIWGAILWLRK